MIILNGNGINARLHLKISRWLFLLLVLSLIILTQITFIDTASDNLSNHVNKLHSNSIRVSIVRPINIQIWALNYFEFITLEACCFFIVLHKIDCTKRSRLRRNGSFCFSKTKKCKLSEKSAFLNSVFISIDERFIFACASNHQVNNCARCFF